MVRPLDPVTGSGQDAVMNTWTVSLTSSLLAERTIIGAADGAEHAREQLFAAAAALIRRTGGQERPRYTLYLGEHLAAIIQTGDDEFGLPDHLGAAELLTAIQQTPPNPFHS
jgi:hypothetical protein